MALSKIKLPAAFTQPLINEVQGIIDAANSDGEKDLAWERIEFILTRSQLMEVGVHINSDYVGVSPHNRSGLGVDGQRSQAHGDEILHTGGYSKKKASDATAFHSSSMSITCVGDSLTSGSDSLKMSSTSMV